MKKMSLALAVLLTTGGMYACNNAANKENADSANGATVESAEKANDQKDDNKTLAVDEKDADFLIFAADAGMTEVEAAKLAGQKTTNAKIKTFAADMIKDHTAAGEEVKALATSKNVSLPGTISEDHQKAISKLSGETKDFDKDYVEQMVDDHQKVVDKFRDASENAKDAEIKAFATKTLPTLESHLAHAKMLKDGMK